MASKGRIFVVEDHATTARALAMYLETQGYHVSVADSVASALKHASQVSFDVLVCDIGLPDGNGWDLMKSLSAIGPVRGIAFSASGTAKPLNALLFSNINALPHLLFRFYNVFRFLISCPR